LALHLPWQAPALPSWKPSLGWSCYAAPPARFHCHWKGRIFYPILAQSEAAQAALGGKGVGAHGTLRFAAPSSFAQLHIMPLLPEFQTRFPDLTLDL